jgi:putative acetyltransferase
MIVDGRIVGGAGIFPTQGLNEDTCELVKMYLVPWARGKGLGKLLMKKCLESATELGYNKIYLETMPELDNALPMYERFGFTYLQGPWGNSGHSGCKLMDG